MVSASNSQDKDQVRTTAVVLVSTDHVHTVTVLSMQYIGLIICDNGPLTVNLPSEKTKE